MRLYEFFTQWLTLGMMFFIIDYNTQWLDVVTLGGLVAGSLMLGFWTVLLDRFSMRFSWYSLHVLMVAIGVVFGVVALSKLMPGYTLTLNVALVVFLVVYACLAVLLGRLLKRKDKEN